MPDIARRRISRFARDPNSQQRPRVFADTAAKGFEELVLCRDVADAMRVNAITLINGARRESG